MFRILKERAGSRRDRQPFLHKLVVLNRVLIELYGVFSVPFSDFLNIGERQPLNESGFVGIKAIYENVLQF